MEEEASTTTIDELQTTNPEEGPERREREQLGEESSAEYLRRLLEASRAGLPTPEPNLGLNTTGQWYLGKMQSLSVEDIRNRMAANEWKGQLARFDWTIAHLGQSMFTADPLTVQIQATKRIIADLDAALLEDPGQRGLQVMHQTMTGMLEELQGQAKEAE